MKCSFIYVDAGKGHYVPAKALYDSCIEKGHEATLDNMILMFGAKAWNKFIKKWWRTHLRHPKMERVINEFSDNTFNRELFELLARNHKRAQKNFRAWYEREKPDLIVSTNYLAGPVLSTIMEKAKVNIPLFVYSADVFDCPNVGLSYKIDIHYLPSKLGIENCVKRGFRREQMKICPFPLKKGLSEYLNYTKEEAREELGLEKDKPVIILNLGGEGIGKTKLLREMAKQKLDYQVVVLGTLKYQTAFHFMVFKKRYPNMKLITPGFVDNVGLYIKACDVQMGKTGANSLMESLYLKRPFLMSELLYTSKAFLTFMKDYKIGWAEDNIKKQLKILAAYFDSPDIQKEIENVLEDLPIEFSSDKFIDQIERDYKEFINKK